MAKLIFTVDDLAEITNRFNDFIDHKVNQLEEEIKQDVLSDMQVLWNHGTIRGMYEAQRLLQQAFVEEPESVLL